MVRTMLRPALALGAVLAAGGYATAGDTTGPGGASSKNDFGAVTMSLVGKGTLASAAADPDDIELTYRGGYRGGFGRTYGGFGRSYGGGRYYGGYGGRYYAGAGRYYGGYGRYYGGYGRYDGGFGRYYAGYGRYYGGYGYRPYYGGFYRPYVWPYFTSLYIGGYYPSYSYGSYYGGSGYYDPCYYDGYVGISGGAVDVTTPALSLTLPTSRPTPAQRVLTPVIAPASGTLRYDDPAGPVPAPQSVTPPRPAAPVAADEVPVSLKAKAAGKPYTFKAYGEK